MKIYKYKHLPIARTSPSFYIHNDDKWYYISRHGLYGIDPPNPSKYQPSSFLELLVLESVSKQQALEKIRKFRKLTELPTR